MRRDLLAFAALAVLLPSPAGAERLPIRAYTTADGLAHNEINKIVRDSRGFLWFATNDGLSRFDGYAFINFGVEHGLPHPAVRDLLETKGGELWIATRGGLVRFNPNGIPSAGIVHALHDLMKDRQGRIWVGTRYKGFFRISADATHNPPVIAERHASQPSGYAWGNRLLEVWLEVTDDGVGFDVPRGSEGNGLGSMGGRAERLGGSLDVVSAPATGTTVRVRMPIRESAIVEPAIPRGR